LFSTTRNTFGFLNCLKKHGCQVGSVAIWVLDSRWVDFSLEESVQLNGERLEQAIEFLRGFLAEGEVTLKAKYLAFRTGQKLLDYVEEIKADLHRDEVQQ
jgi:hypothetical protein